ncbi:MAG: DNA polymerase Y family protein [Planctomycetota bacterium]
MLLSSHERQRRIVARCCARARAAGVRTGMALAQARALFDVSPVIDAYDPVGDRVALRRLAAWSQRFTPVAAMDDASEEPDGLLLDVTGCERVWKGEGRLATAVAQGLGSLGFVSRVAIGPSFGCVWAVSRFGDQPACIIEPGGARDAIARLPVQGLRLADDAVRHLDEVGIGRVGELLELPRRTLPVRFGEQILLRLDQALGQAIETIEPVRVLPPPAMERIFDGPTDRVEAIELTVRDLLGELCAELQRRCCGARRIEFELVRSDLGPEPLSITLGRPSRDEKHLFTLARPKLERAHLGFGVEAVRVRARLVGRIRHEQAEALAVGRGVAPSEAERACDGLLDTLRNRLGTGRVLHAALCASHLPERAFVMQSTEQGQSDPAVGGGSPMDRPSVLFARPVPAEVIALTPDGPVHRVSWVGGGRGVEHAITSCVGPERIAGEWWRAAIGAEDRVRDCFAVRTEGGAWLWLVRRIGHDAGHGRWFVHGVWA